MAQGKRGIRLEFFPDRENTENLDKGREKESFLGFKLWL